MCSSFASLADVLEWRERQRVIPEHERIWGPVSEVEAAKVGCIRAAASVVIMCAIAPSVLNGAVQCIPVELLPRADDTAEELAARLRESTFLDNAHVLNGGNDMVERTRIICARPTRWPNHHQTPRPPHWM